MTRGPNFELQQLIPRHRKLSITEVNLVVDMCPQGNCDEWHDFIQALPEHGLGSTEEAYQLISRSANHRALWFGFGARGKFNVAIDVTPCGTQKLEGGLPARANETRSSCNHPRC